MSLSYAVLAASSPGHLAVTSRLKLELELDWEIPFFSNAGFSSFGCVALGPPWIRVTPRRSVSCKVVIATFLQDFFNHSLHLLICDSLFHFKAAGWTCGVTWGPVFCSA